MSVVQFPSPAAPAGLGLFDYDRLKKAAVNRRQWLVQDLLFEQSINVLVGNSNLGKTPLMVALGVAVASGTPFLGREIPSPGPVFYFDAESGIWQFTELLEAISRHAGLSAPP